jgi:hypothetical protein
VRRTLSKIEVSRISAVDKPAQAPALVRILKRAQTPTELITMSTDLDRLTTACDDLIRKIDRALDLAEDDGNEGPPDMYDSLPNGDDEDVEDEEEDFADTGKRLRKFSNTYHQNTNDEANRPGGLQQHDHGTWHARVQAAVANIAATEGCGKEEALRRLRARQPQLVAGNPRNKSAPLTFEAEVEREIAKSGGYLSPVVAKQRVLYARGASVLDRSTRAAKAVDAEHDFIAKAGAIYEQSAGSISRCESLRAARHAAPGAFKRLQQT